MEDLEQLERQAAGIDAELAQQAPEAQEAQAEAAAQAVLIDQNTQSLGMMLELAGGTFGVVGFPSVAAVLTPENKAALAGVWGPVLTKHGINLGDLGGAYKEEIAAVVVTFPIAMAIAKGIRTDAAARAAAADQGGQVIEAANQGGQVIEAAA